MRITQIREKTVTIASPISNAYIDFSKMTCSVVAVVTDVPRNDKPVIGYGFNSYGRYGQGCLIRERFRPRILPDGVGVQGGYITMPELPGIGFEGKSDLYREMQAFSN
jgi:hypothetical protein